MYFYVYFNPEIINNFITDEVKGNQILIPLFRNFSINCFILDFTDYRIQTNLKECVNKLPDNSLRSEIKKLLGTLNKRNRIIYNLSPNYEKDFTDLELVIPQVKDKNIDILILNNDEEITEDCVCECCHIDKVSGSEFEKIRFALNEGKILQEAEKDETDFLNEVFLKGIKFAQRIEFYDKIFGKRFSDNYIYTTEILFKWLKNILHEPDNCTIVFHCEDPDGERPDYIKKRLQDFKNKYLPKTKIIVQYYQVLTTSGSMQHDRYLSTDQIALELGRGMDMLNRNTHKNRDSKYSYTNMDELKKLIDEYSGNRLTEVII